MDLSKKTRRHSGLPFVLAVVLCTACLLPATGSGVALRRARERLDRGHWFEAVELLSTHLEAEPDDHEARYLLARGLFRLERFDDAVEETLKLPAEALPHGSRRRYLLLRLRMQRVRQLDWNDHDAVLAFARLCARMESYDRAVQAYRYLLSKAENPDFRRELATMLFWSGQYDEALNSWSRYVEDRPDDASARHGLGQVLIALGRIEAAERELAHALRLEPQVEAVRLDYARVMIWLDRLDQADRLLQALMATGTHPVEARLLRADLWLRQNRVEDAYALLLEAAADAPDDQRLQQRLRNLEQSRRLELAILRRRIDANPEQAEDHLRLIDMLLEMQRPGAALRAFNRLPASARRETEIRARIERLRAHQQRSIMRLVREAAFDRRMQPAPERLLAWIDRNPGDELAVVRHADVLPDSVLRSHPSTRGDEEAPWQEN